MKMRSLVLGITVCVAFGITLGQAGAAARSNDRVCSSSSDRGLRLLRESVLRIERRGGERVFVATPINRAKETALTVGVAF
jgi:hypothetical protein